LAVAVVVVAVAVDTGLHTRTVVAADVQMVLVVRLLKATHQHSTLPTSKLTLLEQQQPSLIQYQPSSGPIRPGMKAEWFTGR